ncbi:MAG: prepilin-type N-terminal cleavage/methylation domain-containing protein [Gemmatimonadales bacterium]
MSRTRGMTLIELLIAIVVFFVVLSATLRTLSSQSSSLARGSELMGMLQNQRLGTSLLTQDMQTAGSHLGPDQPPVVYAGTAAFAFNADYAANTAGDPFATYVLPEAPAGQVTAWRLAQAAAVPGSSPVMLYPPVDYADGAGVLSAAETITFFFVPDSETPRADDWILRRQVNAQLAEVVARNILQTPGVPFLRYRRLVRATGAPERVDTVPLAWLPLRHSETVHTGPGDPAVAARIDSLRAVDVSFTLTNGLTGARERSRPVSFTVPLPNIGVARLRTCGEAPVLGQALAASLNLPPGGTAAVDLTWSAAADEAAGEQDVARYVLWRRPVGGADWGDPLVSIPSGNAAYLYTDAAVVPGTTYEYALAAQDCTPSASVVVVSNPVLVP